MHVIPRKRRDMRRNESGQAPVIAVGVIAALVGLVLILVGVTQLGTNEGVGLIEIGLGLMILDVGGFAVIRTPTILIGGVPGFVILVIGVILTQTSHI